MFSGMMKQPRHTREDASYNSDSLFEHPAMKAMHETHSQLHVARTMIDTALKAIPDTTTKGIAIQHLHTASMWLDQARAEGEEALIKALREQQRIEDEAEKAKYYQAELKSSGNSAQAVAKSAMKA